MGRLGLPWPVVGIARYTDTKEDVDEPRGMSMNRTVFTWRVGANGVLHVTVPLSPADADREVVVTIEPSPGPRRPISPEEWRAWIVATAGSVPDPTFFRHEQGEWERRESLP